MLTMILGGLWHGASWAFIVWGCLHGIYLATNHAWQSIHKLLFNNNPFPAWILVPASIALTFQSVVFAWVFFRAKDFEHAVRIIVAMIDFRNLTLPEDTLVSGWLLCIFPSISTAPLDAFGGDRQIAWTLILLFAIWALPNTQQLMSRLQLIDWPKYAKAPVTTWFVVGATSFWLILILMINETRGISEFIYFNF